MYTFTLLVAAIAAFIGLIPLLISEIILKKNRYKLIPESIKLIGLTFGGAAVGLFAGVLGPIYLSPDANQGPLLGIFITGPAGAILGVIVFWGILSWKRKST
jgi:hypothetical protein